MKNPAYDDTMCVASPVAPGVVNTMPEATLDTMLDHGVIEPAIEGGWYTKAHDSLDAWRSVGVDYGDGGSL